MKIVDLVGKLPTHPTKKYPLRSTSEIDTLAIHHSMTDDLPGDKDVYGFARYHITHNDWPGIGYTYVIDADGIIYKCHTATKKTYHVGRHNRRSLGICLVGDFRDYDIEYDQYKALEELVVTCMGAYSIDIDRVLGHSELKGYNWKKCPNINMEKFRKDVMKARG